jgi:hypothetical protein
MQASYTEVRNILKHLHFPLTKQELIQLSKKHGASCKIVEDLESIPEREYTNSEDVFAELEGK